MFELPDGQTATIPAYIFSQICDLFFSPPHLDSKYFLAELLGQTLSKMPDNLRPLVSQTIVLAGGTVC